MTWDLFQKRQGGCRNREGAFVEHAGFEERNRLNAEDHFLITTPENHHGQAKEETNIRAERAAKKKQKRETMIIFFNGKQKRVSRPPKIVGTTGDELIRNNADPVWLHQNEAWELIDPG